MGLSVNYDYDEVIRKVDNVTGITDSSNSIVKVNQLLCDLSNNLQTDQKGQGLDYVYSRFEATLDGTATNLENASNYLLSIKQEAETIKRVQEEEAAEAARKAEEAKMNQSTYNTASTGGYTPNSGNSSYYN